MKMKLLLFLIISQLYSESLDHNESRSCSEIINEIDLLQEEKCNNTSTKVATFIFSGAYVFGMSNKEIDMKIRSLKLELSKCKEIQ